MQVIRSKTTQISTNRSSWPQYVLNMNAGDVLVMFDIRRYEQEMATLAEAAAAAGVVIILFTDIWVSPVARHAAHVFKLRNRSPSAWDSSVVTLFTVEALIEAVQSATWTRRANAWTRWRPCLSAAASFAVRRIPAHHSNTRATGTQSAKTKKHKEKSTTRTVTSHSSTVTTSAPDTH